MAEFVSAAPGVTFLGERPSIDAPELPQKPYEFVMEVDVESLEKMHKVARHRKFEILTTIVVAGLLVAILWFKWRI